MLNTHDAQTNADAQTARQWMQVLAAYKEPSSTRSTFELAITAGVFALLWIAAWGVHYVSAWLALLIVVPASAFLVRLFMIQHDCGHGSFFRNRALNDWVGRAISVLTLTPYDVWRRSHASHHATAGNLDKRGVGDIDTLTVREYEALTPFARLRYRLYRHPFVMFGIGPAYLFLLRHRFPIDGTQTGWRYWSSTMLTNASIVLLFAALIWLTGLSTVLIVHLPIVALAASIGVWLFFVQHQFEETRWASEPGWRWHDAALHGSSHYDLPGALRWLTANIGVHHVHHLQSRIPFYRLPEVLKDHPELQGLGRITIWQSLSCVRLALWDEDKRAMVSFSDARAARQRAGSAGRS